jgi:hypothetical protein
MAKMKTVQVPKAGADFEIVEREIPQPGAGQVRIHVPLGAGKFLPCNVGFREKFRDALL